MHSAAYSEADMALARRIRNLERRILELEGVRDRNLTCVECQMIGTHLGTCSKSAMHGGIATTWR